MRSVYLEGSEGEERQLPKRQTAMWRTETTLFPSSPLLLQHYGSGAIKGSEWWHASLFGEYVKWTIHLLSHTPLQDTKSLPPPSPPLSLSLSKNILIISNNATNRKGCGCSARSVLLAICHSKRHFQLVLDCFCCSTGSVACCNFLRGINIWCFGLRVQRN